MGIARTASQRKLFGLAQTASLPKQRDIENPGRWILCRKKYEKGNLTQSNRNLWNGQILSKALIISLSLSDNKVGLYLIVRILFIL
jgi:hypothetical protein